MSFEDLPVANLTPVQQSESEQRNQSARDAINKDAKEIHPASSAGPRVDLTPDQQQLQSDVTTAWIQARNEEAANGWGDGSIRPYGAPDRYARMGRIMDGLAVARAGNAPQQPSTDTQVSQGDVPAAASTETPAGPDHVQAKKEALNDERNSYLYPGAHTLPESQQPRNTAQVDGGGEGISAEVAKQVAAANLRRDNVTMSEFGQAGGVGPASVPIFNGPKGNSIT